MKKLIVGCALLLIVQVGLAVLTNLHRQAGGMQPATGPLLAIPNSEIDELLLEDGEGKRLVLHRETTGWVLPALENFPADAPRIQGLIEQLTGARRGWPEATTAEAASRFKVAVDRFERRLTLRAGGKELGRVYFGSSPGLRKIYLRVDGDNRIQALTLDASQLDLDVNAWIDTGVCRLEERQITAIELPDLHLVRQGETIQPVGLQAVEEAVPERVKALVKAIAELRILTVLGREPRPEYGLDKPVLHFTVEVEGGRRIDYFFGQETKPAGEQQTPSTTTAILKVSHREALFRVDDWQVEEIRNATRATLVRAKPQEAAAPKEKDSGSEANKR